MMVWRNHCIQTGVWKASKKHGGGGPLQVEISLHLSGDPEASHCFVHVPGLVEDKE